MKDFATEEKLTVREQREKTERILKRVASSSALMMFATGLSGCFRDEGGSSGTSFTGSVFDGPLKSAKVFIDANNNGLLDENEDWTLTSSDGSYSLSTSTTGNLAVVTTADTVDTSSGAIVAGLTLTAPSGSSIISPATTVVESILDAYKKANPGASETDIATQQTQAYADTAEALGLSADVDLTSYNPFSSSVDSTSADAIAYAAKAAQIVAVANTIAEAESASAGGGDKGYILSEALSAVATEIAASAAADSIINIDAAFVGNIIAAAAPTMNANATLKSDVSSAIGNVSSSLGNITDVSTTSDIFYASQALLVEAAVESAASGVSNAVLNVLKDNTTDIGALATSLVKVTGSTRSTLSEDATPDATSGDISTTGTLSLSDPDSTDDITYKFSTTVVDLGGNTGSLSITEAGVWTYTYGSANVAALNALQAATAKGTFNDGLVATDAGYKDDSNFQITEAFKVSVLDSNGAAVELVAGVPLTKTIIVSLEGANDAVVLESTAAAIADQGAYVQGDTITNVTTSNQFADPDTAEKLTYSATGLPPGVTINADTGVISGAPSSDALGDYSVVVSATDVAGTKASIETSFNFTVTNLNDAPAATSSGAVTASASEDSAFTYDASALFSDPDIANSHDENDVLTYTISSNPSWLSIDTTTGALSGTPENADVAITTVTITATDAYGLAATQDVTITVANTNDAPTAAAVDLGIQRDSVSVSYDKSDFASGVTDVDVGDTYILTALSQTSGASGTITDNGDGSFSFAPVDGTENETVSFSYTVTDAADESATSTATLQVVDAIPAGSGAEDGTAISVVNSEYSGATYTLESGQDAKGVYDSVAGTFTPAADFNGSVNFTLTPAGGGASLPAIVTVTAVNDLPVVGSSVSATLAVVEDTAANGSITATDVDGDTLTYTYSTPAKGTITDVDADGTFTYTPAANANGSDSFVITVNENGTASTITQNVAVTIEAVADEPSGESTKDLAVTEDTTASGTVAVTDGDGDSLTYTYSTPAKGTIADNGSGSYSYVPAANETGSDSFTVVVSDGDSTTNDLTQTVSVTISAVNDDPTVVGTGISNQNATSSFSLSDNLSTFFSDVDGDTLTYTAISSTGAASVSSAGALSVSGLTPGTTTVTVTASDGKGGTDATDSFDLTVLGDLITSTTTKSGNTYTVDLSLNQNGVQTAAMESVTGFEFQISAAGTATSSDGLVASDDIPPLYASVDTTSISRDGLTAVTAYTPASNFQSNIFTSSSSNWEFSAGDAVPIISEASSWKETISGTEYELISKFTDSNSIGKITFTLESDVTDFDLTINGTISGYDAQQAAVGSAETITAVTIDIV